MTLQEQIEALSEGESFDLGSGLWELSAPLLLQRPIQLVGQGAHLRLVSGHEAVVRVVGGGMFRLQGLHLEYACEGPGRGLWVEAGEVHLEDCQIWGGRWVDERGLGCGVHFARESRGRVSFCELRKNQVGLLVDHQAQVQLESNRLIDNVQAGLRLQGYSRSRVLQNECRGNGQSGILVQGQAWAELEGNRSHANGMHGIHLLGQARIRLLGNECTSNAQHGVSMEESSSLTMEQQVCEENGLCGLDIGGQSQALVSGTYCCLNAWHGMQIRDTAHAALTQSRCRHNQQSGLAYYGRSAGQVSQCWMEENEHYGLQVSDRARPFLQAIQCSRNGLSGLAYFGESAGTACEMECRGHAYHGIQVSDSARPLLEGNTCEQNQLFGLACFGNSRAILRDNRAVQNEQGGLYLGDTAHTLVLDNQVQQGDKLALQAAGKTAGWVSGNRLEGQFLIGTEATPWLERNQVEGSFTCLSDRVFELEHWMGQHSPMRAGHYLQLVNTQGMPFQVSLPFEPKASERSVMESLARFGRVSEAELAKIAKTRRIAGLVEGLREKLVTAQLKWIHCEGQGRDGLIYAWVGPESG